MTPAGQRNWFHPDERGSIVAVSRADGTVQTVKTYDAYGRVGWNGYRFSGIENQKRIGIRT